MPNDDTPLAHTSTPSLKTLVSIYAQQSESGKVVRFTGSGSKDHVRMSWEKVTDDIVVAATDYEALFDIVFTLLRSPVNTELPTVGDELALKRVKRVLYSFLKTVLGAPASLVLSQDDLPRTMDGIVALAKLRAKYEPLQKTHFRKELILDVIMFKLNGTTNPEPALLRWIKAIDHLKQAGCDSLDSLLRDILVNSLSPEYSTLISMWDESDGGANGIDRDAMIRSICTHFEHVVLPSTPSARKNVNSAYQQYQDHVHGSGKGKPHEKDGERSREKYGERSRGGEPSRDKNRTKGADAANKGLQDARNKQKHQEMLEKYKNTVCHLCGEKGHSPNWQGCVKHPNHNPSAGKPGPTPANKKVKGAQLPSSGITINDDHFITLDSPRSESGASEE